MKRTVLALATAATVGLTALGSSPAISAGQPTPTATEIGSRQRCMCGTTNRSTRVVRQRHYYKIRSAYLIGYDVLPYRFGSTYVWEPPYRYYRSPPR